MKRFYYTLFILMLLFSGCKIKDVNETSLIVASYSVRAQPQISSHEQRDLLERNKVEVAALQVVDRYTKRNPYDMVDVLAKGKFKYTHFTKIMDYSYGEYGILSLSSFPILHTSEFVLPLGEGNKEFNTSLLAVLKQMNDEDEQLTKQRDDLIALGALEPRMMQRIVFEKEGKEVTFYNVHLSFEDNTIRKQQLEYIKCIFDKDTSKYKILAGTFNNDQSSEELSLFEKEYQLANGLNGNWLDTYPLDDDEKMRVFSIDNIICTNNMEIEEVTMVPSNLSNHNPLIVKLLLQ